MLAFCSSFLVESRKTFPFFVIKKEDKLVFLSKNLVPPCPTYLPILSTSSISTRGFSVPVFFKHCTNFPGIAPTYVRLWPFISATSVIPPTENLKYCLLRALAIERAEINNQKFVV